MAVRPKEESPVMAQGYDHYLSLGVNRSLEAVAQLMNRPLRTVQQWAKDWNWEGRYKQHTVVHGETPYNEAFAPEEILQRFPLVEGGAAMSKHEYRSVLGSLVRDFVDRFKAGDIQIRNITDFEKIVKLDLLLMGEATSRNDTTTSQEHVVKVEHIVEHNPLARDLIATMWRDYTNPNLTAGMAQLHGLTTDITIIDDVGGNDEFIFPSFTSPTPFIPPIPPIPLTERIRPNQPKLNPVVKSPVNIKDVLPEEEII